MESGWGGGISLARRITRAWRGGAGSFERRFMRAIKCNSFRFARRLGDKGRRGGGSAGMVAWEELGGMGKILPPGLQKICLTELEGEGEREVS